MIFLTPVSHALKSEDMCINSLNAKLQIGGFASANHKKLKNWKFSIRSFKNIAQSKDLHPTSKNFKIGRFAKFTRKYKFPWLFQQYFISYSNIISSAYFNAKTQIGDFAPTNKKKQKQKTK